MPLDAPVMRTDLPFKPKSITYPIYVTIKETRIPFQLFGSNDPRLDDDECGYLGNKSFGMRHRCLPSGRRKCRV